MSITLRDQLVDLRAELICAIRQSLPSDDQIIMDHVRKASEGLGRIIAILDVEAAARMREEVRAALDAEMRALVGGTLMDPVQQPDLSDDPVIFASGWREVVS